MEFSIALNITHPNLTLSVSVAYLDQPGGESVAEQFVVAAAAAVAVVPAAPAAVVSAAQAVVAAAAVDSQAGID